MDVQIHVQDETQVFTSGDTITGKVLVHCSQPTTISRFTMSLIGESSSSLTGAPGLLFSRREEETHTFLREEFCIISTSRVSKPRESRPVRLDTGCHSFDFRLRVPWVQDCSSCPPNTPVEANHEQNYAEEKSKSNPSRRLPPSTSDLIKGNKVAYRVDAAVTMMRNMFKSRTIKVC